MFATSDVRGAPPFGGPAHVVIRWVCTNNPFYIISAGLFLFGLRISFGAQVRDLEVGALMSGLAGYTLLLAATALVLVRFGNVWDDVRTVMLLVVLMFLATSVTFDELLVAQPNLGRVCGLGGFAFAVLVSEVVLRSIRLSLPAWYRGPYYLILGLFFLYPLALTPILRQPKSEVLQWGLFGFSTVTGLAFLTLLPAIRRGPDYVRGNGSPWNWPLYPWVVFGVLALATPARALLMCFSMHWLDMAQGNRSIFGGYFLAPFGLCLAVLILELGIVSGRRVVSTAALLMPFGSIILSVIGHQSDPVYQGFLRTFTERLGGDPYFWTMIGAALFYCYAGVRRVEGSLGAATGMLAALAILGPDPLTPVHSRAPMAWPMALAALIQIGVAIQRRNAWNWLLSAGAAFAFTILALDGVALGEIVAVHVFIAILAVGGAMGDNVGAGYLRLGAGLSLLAVAGNALLGNFSDAANLPRWVGEAYPFVAATVLGCYGLVIRDKKSVTIAIAILGAWFVKTGWQGYVLIRSFFAGFDQVMLSLVLFVVAVVVSMGKSGRLPRWFVTRGWITDEDEPARIESEATP